MVETFLFKNAINVEKSQNLRVKILISIPTNFSFVQMVYTKNRFYRESDYLYDVALFAFEYGLALRLKNLNDNCVG